MNHIILKQRVSKDSLETNLFFLLTLFREQKICKKNFHDVKLYDFGNEFSNLQQLLKKLKLPESCLVKTSFKDFTTKSLTPQSFTNSEIDSSSSDNSNSDESVFNNLKSSRNKSEKNNNITTLEILLFPENIKTIAQEEKNFITQHNAAITIMNVYIPEPDFSKEYDSWTSIVENGKINL